MIEFTDYYEVLRKNIRKYRKIFGLSQSDLSLKVGCNSGTIGNIESNSVRFHASVETYCLIAEVLGVNIKDLLNPVEEKLTSPIKVRLTDDYKNFDYSKYYNDVINNIVKYRKFRDMTQGELAEKANMSQVFLATIETGKKNFSIETIGNISDALNIDIRLLFEED